MARTPRAAAPVERPPVTLCSPLLLADRVGAVARVVTVGHPRRLGDGGTHARVVSVDPLRVDVCGVEVACRTDGVIDPRRVVRDPLDTQGDERGGEAEREHGQTVRTAGVAQESER